VALAAALLLAPARRLRWPLSTSAGRQRLALPLTPQAAAAWPHGWCWRWQRHWSWQQPLRQRLQAQHCHHPG
jgi:hypothetical protein